MGKLSGEEAAGLAGGCAREVMGFFTYPREGRERCYQDREEDKEDRACVKCRSYSWCTMIKNDGDGEGVYRWTGKKCKAWKEA